MKKNIIIVLVFLFTTSQVLAQSSTSDSAVLEEVGYGVVEDMPYFRGGTEKMHKFIQDQIRYDSIEEIKNDITIFISCTVDTHGKTSLHYILNNSRDDIDREALRISRLIEFDKPAKQRGNPIKIKEYAIPVKFYKSRLKQNKNS